MVSVALTPKHVEAVAEKAERARQQVETKVSREGDLAVHQESCLWVPSAGAEAEEHDADPGP